MSNSGGVASNVSSHRYESRTRRDQQGKERERINRGKIERRELPNNSVRSVYSTSSNASSRNSTSSPEQKRNDSDDSIDSSSSSSIVKDNSELSEKSKESNSDNGHSSPVRTGQTGILSDESSAGSSFFDENFNGEFLDINNDIDDNDSLFDELPPYLPAIQGSRSVEEYKCLNRIAEGTYGVVYRAQDKRTKEIFALKKLKLLENGADDDYGFPITSLREVNTLLKVQHPNIVTVREIVIGNNTEKIYMVMDYVEHDLKSLMDTMKENHQVFLVSEVKCLMQQLLRAVAHIHDNWILHRDLKTSNLLLSHNGVLKVGDFGLAREYGTPIKPYTSLVVTLWYRAPELLLGTKTYSTPVDVWSVGCIFAELLKMQPLFQAKSEIDLLHRIFKELGTPDDQIWPGYSDLPFTKKINFRQYPSGKIRQKFNILSELGMDLLLKFLTYDPERRISAEEALEHGYFDESPEPIDPSKFPTWPAKSEFGKQTVNQSPKAPRGGNQCLDAVENEKEEEMACGFHMGGRAVSRQAIGAGFHLQF
ncbi:unnamed protein product [Trichogramma brassicae]|uniref:cyclin-dependent kinase n=1 Tax=Trichogramma brassicae TaxID=86971 RepID=A0A6H5IIG9_9HYME|nr:unnamed protein product [Trichogramma brassicae]